MLSSAMEQLNVALPVGDMDWVRAEAARLGTTKSAVVREAVRVYREHASAEPAPTAPTPQTEENAVPRPKTRWNTQTTPKKKGRWTADNPMPLSERVEPPRTSCDRCGASVNVLDGEPAYHLRPSTPQDDNYSAEVPTMSPCVPQQPDAA